MIFDINRSELYTTTATSGDNTITIDLVADTSVFVATKIIVEIPTWPIYASCLLISNLCVCNFAKLKYHFI